MLFSFSVIPRVMFEDWSLDSIIKLYGNTESQTQLIVSLLDAAQVRSRLLILG